MSETNETTSGLELAKERAQANLETTDDSAPSNKEETPLAPHVEFLTGGRWYAVDAHSVASVVAEGAITRVPGRSKHILGLALIQDALIPVIDLALFTGTSSSGGADRQALTQARLVVVSHKDNAVAILAEEARGIEMLPSTLEGTPDGIIAGESHWEDQHMFHLAPEALVDLGND